MADRLTRQQREIQKDLRAIVEELGFEYENILETKREYRSIALHRTRVTMIRGFIVEKYVMIDERLSSVICRFFFDTDNFIRLWETKRFTFFNYYILEKMSLREKFVLAKAIRKMPNAVADAIERINAARNIVAHNFFPENVRDLRIKKSGRAPSIPIVYPYKGHERVHPRRPEVVPGGRRQGSGICALPGDYCAQQTTKNEPTERCRVPLPEHVTSSGCLMTGRTTLAA
jgi:hypothetical protein